MVKTVMREHKNPEPLTSTGFSGANVLGICASGCFAFLHLSASCYMCGLREKGQGGKDRPGPPITDHHESCHLNPMSLPSLEPDGTS